MIGNETTSFIRILTSIIGIVCHVWYEVYCTEKDGNRWDIVEGGKY